MELISQLNEASALPIEDLKKVLSKDARVKQVFSKSLPLEDIRNKAEFLQTLKFFVFNNRNVLNFVDDREYIKGLNKTALKKFRELKPLELKQTDVDNILEFMNVLFREHAHVERSGMSPSLRKELLDWVNANGRFFNLSRHAQKELLSLPNVRPTRPILVYRGLLFNASDLRERKRYDGQLEVGAGLKFLRSIREGSRIVDLEWDRASSWSTSKKTAMQFAKFGPASSNFSATMQWLERGAAKREIDGDLGFIIATLAQPEDVLIQVDRMVTTAHRKHGDEGEVILKPGTYTCRISTKYTKSGEVDPIESSTVSEAGSTAIDATKNFYKEWLPESFDELLNDGWRSVDAERSLSQGDLKKFLKIASGEVRSRTLQAYAELKEFYTKYIADLKDAEVEQLVADPKTNKIAQWIKDLRTYMNGSTRHHAHKTDENPRGSTTEKELTPEQAREAQFSGIHKKIKDASGPGRYTDYSTGNIVNTLLKAVGKSTIPDLHRKGRKDQEAAMDEVIDGFFKDRTRPADREEAIKTMMNTALAAERNAGMLSRMLGMRKSLSEILGPAEESNE